MSTLWRIGLLIVPMVAVSSFEIHKEGQACTGRAAVTGFSRWDRFMAPGGSH